MDTIIILSILVSGIVLPIILLKLYFRNYTRPWRETFFKVNQAPINIQKELGDLTPTKCEILKEIFMLPAMRGTFILLFKGSKKLTQGEKNIIQRKIIRTQFGKTAFPIIEGASKGEINKWLEHPHINTPMCDSMLLDIAENTPIPPEIIENILKRLLGDQYNYAFEAAEKKVLDRKSSLKSMLSKLPDFSVENVHYQKIESKTSCKNIS